MMVKEMVWSRCNLATSIFMMAISCQLLNLSMPNITKKLHAFIRRFKNNFILIHHMIGLIQKFLII